MSDSQYIYVAQTQDGKYCKIGATCCMRTRMEGIRAASYRLWGQPSRYLAAWRCTSDKWKKEEYAIHGMFSESRVSGTNEWYHTTPDLITYADSMNDARVELPIKRVLRRRRRKHPKIDKPTVIGDALVIPA